MTITIRNSEVEATIRRIGEKTGEEPETVVARLLRSEPMAAASAPSAAEVKRRLGRMEALRRAFRPGEPRSSWAEIEGEVTAILGADLR